MLLCIDKVEQSTIGTKRNWKRLSTVPERVGGACGVKTRSFFRRSTKVKIRRVLVLLPLLAASRDDIIPGIVFRLIVGPLCTKRRDNSDHRVCVCFDLCRSEPYLSTIYLAIAGLKQE